MSTYAYPVRNAKGEAVISTGEAEFEERPFWGRFFVFVYAEGRFFLNSAPLINNLKMD